MASHPFSCEKKGQVCVIYSVVGKRGLVLGLPAFSDKWGCALRQEANCLVNWGVGAWWKNKRWREVGEGYGRGAEALIKTWSLHMKVRSGPHASHMDEWMNEWEQPWQRCLWPLVRPGPFYSPATRPGFAGGYAGWLPNSGWGENLSLFGGQTGRRKKEGGLGSSAFPPCATRPRRRCHSLRRAALGAIVLGRPLHRPTSVLRSAHLFTSCWRSLSPTPPLPDLAKL